MSRYLVLVILLLFITLANFMGYGHIHANAIQESTISDYKNSNDDHSLDNISSGNHNTIFQDLILLVFIILFLTKSINLLTKFKKRYILLIPIFYQSNYVDTPLLKKSH